MLEEKKAQKCADKEKQFANIKCLSVKCGYPTSFHPSICIIGSWSTQQKWQRFWVVASQTVYFYDSKGGAQWFSWYVLTGRICWCMRHFRIKRKSVLDGLKITNNLNLTSKTSFLGEIGVGRPFSCSLCHQTQDTRFYPSVGLKLHTVIYKGMHQQHTMFPPLCPASLHQVTFQNCSKVHR